VETVSQRSIERFSKQLRYTRPGSKDWSDDPVARKVGQQKAALVDRRFYCEPEDRLGFLGREPLEFHSNVAASTGDAVARLLIRADVPSILMVQVGARSIASMLQRQSK